MSTTEATLTTDAGNTYDIWGEIGEFEFQLSGNTVVGDTTTGIDVRQIWSDAFGKSLGQKLVQVDIVNGLNAILYMMIFTKDNPVTNDVPVLPVIKIPIPGVAGTVFKCPFGASGLSVYSQDSNGTKHYGCTIALSTTPIKLTIEGSDASTIRAFYHTQ
jgi:hypothetical protein